MAERKDSFTQKEIISVSVGNANVRVSNRARIDEGQHLETHSSYVDLVLKNLVQDEETDLSWNLHQQLKFDDEGELCEINLQKVEMSENPEKAFAENIRSRLLNVLAMSSDCEAHLRSFLERLRAEIRELIPLRIPRRVRTLEEKISHWTPFHLILISINSKVQTLIERVARDADVLTDKTINNIRTKCDKLEDNVHTLISFILEAECQSL